MNPACQATKQPYKMLIIVDIMTTYFHEIAQRLTKAYYKHARSLFIMNISDLQMLESCTCTYCQRLIRNQYAIHDRQEPFKP